jgi:hypothetical protein
MTNACDQTNPPSITHLSGHTISATYLCNYYVYPEEWMYSPQFLVGTTVFLTGLARLHIFYKHYRLASNSSHLRLLLCKKRSYINITSDRYLISLKKKSKNGAYLIPRVFDMLFTTVCCLTLILHIVHNQNSTDCLTTYRGQISLVKS